MFAFENYFLITYNVDKFWANPKFWLYFDLKNLRHLNRLRSTQNQCWFTFDDIIRPCKLLGFIEFCVTQNITQDSLKTQNFKTLQAVFPVIGIIRLSWLSDKSNTKFKILKLVPRSDTGALSSSKVKQAFISVLVPSLGSSSPVLVSTFRETRSP